MQISGFPWPKMSWVASGGENILAIAKLCSSSGYESKRIRITPSCVRGLEYYTGTVFECEITADIPNEKGEIVQFGSVAGGGRYDGLVKRFTGQEVPATGFSIGVSRLATALKNLGQLDTEAPEGPIVVTVMDKDAEALAGYQKLVQMLRESENADGVKDLRAEMYQGNPKNFGKQLQYADRRGSPIAIIQGSAEREEGTVQIKDLVEGARLSADITDHTEWRGEEGVRPAQQTVKVEDMVATVREILERAMPDLTAFLDERTDARPEVAILQPADPFLDVAGEDMRRRVFMTQMSDGAPLCLRPEFTIPICLMDLPAGRYAYDGTVFRQEREGANEFRQAGLEDLGHEPTPARDAAALADMREALAVAGADDVSMTLGDHALFDVVVVSLGLPATIAARLSRAFGGTGASRRDHRPSHRRAGPRRSTCRPGRHAGARRRSASLNGACDRHDATGRAACDRRTLCCCHCHPRHRAGAGRRLPPRQHAGAGAAQFSRYRGTARGNR